MLNLMVSRLLAATSLACFAMVFAPAVYTQDGTGEAEGAQPREWLPEIIVTAQKRTENLQDVPVPVSALNAGQIERSFRRDISEIGALSPNLVIDPLCGDGVASTSIGIRGIQLNDVEKSLDPAVAVYLYDVYLSTNTGALLNTVDADAVEVLRGPQGTLFGRNTIGGLVHLRRQEPTSELGAKVLEILRPKDVRLKSMIANDTGVVSLLDLVFEDGDGEFAMPVADYWGEQICRVEPYLLDTVRLNEFLARHG